VLSSLSISGATDTMALRRRIWIQVERYSSQTRTYNGSLNQTETKITQLLVALGQIVFTCPRLWKRRRGRLGSEDDRLSFQSAQGSRGCRKRTPREAKTVSCGMLCAYYKMDEASTSVHHIQLTHANPHHWLGFNATRFQRQFQENVDFVSDAGALSARDDGRGTA
jgi:hypothetical protein